MKTQMKILKCFLLVIVFVVTQSCTHTQKSFEEKVQADRCEEALESMPEHDPMVKLINTSEQAAGTVASYAFVGASYTAEVLWNVTGGTVMILAMCAPGMVASVMANGNGTVAGHLCFPGSVGSMSAFAAPPLGRQAKKSSKHLQCPNIEGLNQSMRAVASCYEARGTDEDLKKAKKTLQSIRNSSDFYECLSKDEKEKTLKQLEELKSVEI